ncbi:hypothetical protein LJB77_01265 [Ruminococcaceae bacterium OttesenSCG-928-N02]|nr:hypothetical protein [Ruminococcaceae bacterium OttesenSCG-928-N02]
MFFDIQSTPTIKLGKVYSQTGKKEEKAQNDMIKKSAPRGTEIIACIIAPALGSNFSQKKRPGNKTKTTKEQVNNTKPDNLPPARLSATMYKVNAPKKMRTEHKRPSE